MIKQRNILIKPIRIEKNNRLLKIKSTEDKGSSQGQVEDDNSSVSSVDSDIGGFNIWDNSELKLRGIDTEQFVNFYGRQVDFLQMYKLRSSFYEKGVSPSIGEIFKGAEKIHKFCSQKLKLDQFLEEDKQDNVLEISWNKDKNFLRFSAHFNSIVSSNSLKHREDKYNRYSQCNELEKGADEIQQSSPLKKPIVSTLSHLSGLNLSPCKLPSKKNKLDLFDQNTCKPQLNLQQIEEQHRKNKINEMPHKPALLSPEDQKNDQRETQFNYPNRSFQSQNMNENKIRSYVNIGETDGNMTKSVKLESKPGKLNGVTNKQTSNHSTWESKSHSPTLHQREKNNIPEVGEFRLKLQTISEKDASTNQIRLRSTTQKPEDSLSNLPITKVSPPIVATNGLNGDFNKQTQSTAIPMPNQIYFSRASGVMNQQNTEKRVQQDQSLKFPSIQSLNNSPVKFSKQISKNNLIKHANSFIQQNLNPQIFSSNSPIKSNQIVKENTVQKQQILLQQNIEKQQIGSHKKYKSMIS